MKIVDIINLNYYYSDKNFHNLAQIFAILIMTLPDNYLNYFTFNFTKNFIIAIINITAIVLIDFHKDFY